MSLANNSYLDAQMVHMSHKGLRQTVSHKLGPINHFVAGTL